MKIKMLLILLILLFVVGLIITFSTQELDFKADWRTADRSSAGLAPSPITYQDAVIQVYGARTFNWRGLVAIHTWIVIKPKNAIKYTVYQVIGWRSFWSLPVYVSETDIPDRLWFGNKPQLLKDIRGMEAEKLIPKIKLAAESYPYKNTYHYWPGPNSNTFTAFVLRNVPELQLALPPIAIGKDFLGITKIFAKTPSNTGYQLSVLGIVGLTIARIEGFEINILGFVFGISFNPHIAIILPGIGKIPLGKHLDKKQEATL